MIKLPLFDFVILSLYYLSYYKLVAINIRLLNVKTLVDTPNTIFVAQKLFPIRYGEI